jgi:hypothetical protein
MQVDMPPSLWKVLKLADHRLGALLGVCAGSLGGAVPAATTGRTRGNEQNRERNSRRSHAAIYDESACLVQEGTTAGIGFEPAAG